MTTAELTVIERAAVVLGTSEREKEMLALVAKSTDIVEIKNTAGRDQCHGAAMTLRTARTSIRKVGKDARDDATKFSKAVIAEEDRLVALIEPEETRLIGMRDVWDEAREAEKRAKLEAEQRRIAAIREQIGMILKYAHDAVGHDSGSIKQSIETLTGLEITIEIFADLTGEAETARGTTLDKLCELHTATIAQEAEVARLAAEREAIERERAELEALREREKAERIERERVEALARAELERIDSERRESEEAARREQREREEAEHRAAVKAEELRFQSELNRAVRERREREEAAEREVHAREEASNRERQRCEREDFLMQGPGLEALVDVIAAHYHVESTTVHHWLSIYDVQLPEVTAPQAA